MNRYSDIELLNKRLPPVCGYWNEKLVSLEEALKPIESRIDELNRLIKVAKRYCTYPSEHDLTRDESAAIYLYTMESGQNSFYKLLNEALRSENRSALRPWFSYLKLFDVALKKLPTVKGCVWRGVPGDISEQFRKGQVLTWWGISSCSQEMDVIQGFVDPNGSSTLFMIEAINGTDVSKYSYFSNENEVILGLGTELQMKGNKLKHHGGPNIVHLVELNDNDDDVNELPEAIVKMDIQPKISDKGAMGITTKQTTAFASTSVEPKFIKASPPYVPLRAPAISIHPNARWQRNGLTVAGGNEQGNGTNQLSHPFGLYIDDDQTIYIADTWNHRIIEWKWNATRGKVVAGGNKERSEAHHLSYPRDVIVDKEKDNLIICDWGNRRVVQWPRRNGTSGETIISNINCVGLKMDENGSLYVIDYEKHEVRRYRRGESQVTVVAGGNGNGNRLDQLSYPQYVFVDRDHSVYVSDYGNDCVMKWMEGTKEGIVVAGGQGKGNSLRQLSNPYGVVVDQLDTVYVADCWNDRIMRWMKGTTQGSIIVGENGRGEQSNQLNRPIGLSFDRHGNLYVVDYGNHRVQKFNIDGNA